MDTASDVAGFPCPVLVPDRRNDCCHFRLLCSHRPAITFCPALARRRGSTSKASPKAMRMYEQASNLGCTNIQVNSPRKAYVYQTKNLKWVLRRRHGRVLWIQCRQYHVPRGLVWNTSYRLQQLSAWVNTRVATMTQSLLGSRPLFQKSGVDYYSDSMLLPYAVG